MLRLGGRVDAIAGRDNGVPDGIGLERSRSVLYAGSFGGEADIDVCDTRDTRHRVLNTTNARGAGHAGDRNLSGEERARSARLSRGASRTAIGER